MHDSFMSNARSDCIQATLNLILDASVNHDYAGTDLNLKVYKDPFATPCVPILFYFKEFNNI